MTLKELGIGQSAIIETVGGTGALRQYIRRYLDTVDAVRGYHDEDVRLGGAGITVVEFQ